MNKICKTIAFAIAVVAFFVVATKDADAQRRLSQAQVDSIYASLPTMKDEDRLKAYYDLARTYHPMDSIIKYSMKTYKLAKQLKKMDVVASSCEVIGWYYNTVGKYEEAPGYFQEAGEFFLKSGLNISYAMMLSGIGDSYIGLGLFDEGIDVKLQALKFFDEEDDHGSAALIFRTIGSACTEFQQYKIAMTNLDKALECDKLIKTDTPVNQFKADRGLGRDYFYLGQNVNLCAENDNIGSKMLAKDLLIHGIEYQEKARDYIFVIKSCALLSFIYNDMILFTDNWDFADSSLHYYKKGRGLIERNGYKMFDDVYEIAHTEHTLLSGNYFAALKTLQTKIEDNSLDPITLLLLNQAFRFYFHYNNDYKGLLELMERIEAERKRLYISEFSLQIQKINNIKSLSDQYAMIKRTSESRKSEFESTRHHHSQIRRIAIILLVLSVAAIAAITYLNIRNRQYSKRLREQSDEIEAANEELSTLMLENQRQSELITKQTAEMKRQRNKLASINLRIVLNLDIASRFQASLMPSIDTVKRIFKDVFVLWRPLEEVSGDFYWCTEIGGLKYVAVADCTGHGIPGASLSMLGISFLNGIVARTDRESMNAADILVALRERIVESLTRGSVHNEDIHDGMDIAVCIFDPKRSTLSYAGAYRPLWIVDGGGELTEYKADKIPVAVDKDRTDQYTNHEIDLHSGDCAYIFSDGVTDQFGVRENGKLSKLKPKRLRDLLCKIHSYPPQQQQSEIEHIIDDWRGDNEQTDDMIMVGVMNI